MMIWSLLLPWIFIAWLLWGEPSTQAPIRASPPPRHLVTSSITHYISHFLLASLSTKIVKKYVRDLVVGEDSQCMEWIQTWGGVKVLKWGGQTAMKYWARRIGGDTVLWSPFKYLLLQPNMLNYAAGHAPPAINCSAFSSKVGRRKKLSLCISST